MFTCERCGASLPVNTDQCVYCGTVSAPARRELQAEAARVLQVQAPLAAQAAITKRVAQVNTEQAASRALLWGLLSPIFVCLPFPTVLAVMAHNRATRLARDGGIPVPTRARVGLALGVFCGLGFVAGFLYMCIDMHADTVRVDARIAALAKVIDARGTSPTLDHEFACALAETRLLTDGFAGKTNVGAFRDLQCMGAVHVVKDRAELGNFKLLTTYSSPVTAVICFRHGSSWSVESTGFTSCGLEH